MHTTAAECLASIILIGYCHQVHPTRAKYSKRFLQYDPFVLRKADEHWIRKEIVDCEVCVPADLRPRMMRRCSNQAAAAAAATAWMHHHYYFDRTPTDDDKIMMQPSRFETRTASCSCCKSLQTWNVSFGIEKKCTFDLYLQCCWRWWWWRWWWRRWW